MAWKREKDHFLYFKILEKKMLKRSPFIDVLMVMNERMVMFNLTVYERQHFLETIFQFFSSESEKIIHAEW